MKPSLYLLISLYIGLISCKNNFADKPKQQEYFEGLVESKVTIRTNSASRKDALQKTFGTAAKTHIRQDMVYREFYNENYMLRKELQRMDLAKAYVFNTTWDICLLSNMHDTSQSKLLSIKEIEGKIILNRYCIGVATTVLNQEKGLPPVIMTINYYLDTLTHLQPDLYRGVTYGGFNELFSKYPFVTFGYTLIDKQDDFEVESIATKITPTKLNDSYFAIPSNKKFVEQF